MVGKLSERIKHLSGGKKIALGVISFIMLSSVATAGHQSSSQNLLPQPPMTQVSEVRTPKVEKKTVTETQAIPFQKTTTNDDTLKHGEIVLRIAGKNGIRTFTYEVILTDGIETDKKLIKDEVTAAAVHEVTAVGTKMSRPALSCPNGTYTNSSGDEVCRPFESPSTPAGATARCEDGTYSYSQSRRGTCSHHGGVAVWL